jgi:hypothetical protein
LHTGTPTLTGEGYIGVDVHRGARVAGLAHGGQIILSPTTEALRADSDGPVGLPAALAQAAHARGELDRAGLLWGCAETEVTDEPFRVDRDRFAGSLLAEEAPLFTAARERGRKLDLWDAVAVALGELEPPQTEP